jgi:hypothetical protein
MRDNKDETKKGKRMGFVCYSFVIGMDGLRWSAVVCIDFDMCDEVLLIGTDW